jgi:hypothetical protein
MDKPVLAAAQLERERQAIEDAFAHVDRTAFSVVSLHDEPDDTAYWLSRTPYERMLAVEMLRRIVYGYDPTAARLQRVFEVTELESS